MSRFSVRSAIGVAGLSMWLGCASQEQFGLGTIKILNAGVINDPRNKSLRFDLLQYGLNEFCTEMRRRGAELKLRDEDPVIGRFFAQSCATEVIDTDGRQSFVVRYGGTGYGWTNLSQRLGFSAAGLVEYAADFMLHDEAMYIYFRPRHVDATTFQVTLVESLMAQVGISLTQLDPNAVGRNIIESQLQRGFTVIRLSERGETEFAFGIVPPGARPFRPFQVGPSDRVTLANNRTEVHVGQQDFIGGFHLAESGQQLIFQMMLDGAPAIDVLLLAKSAGDLMLPGYVSRPGPAALIGAPVVSLVLSHGVPLVQRLKLPAGDYYLLLDHSPAVGATAPPYGPLDDRAARVDYLVQLGDSD